MPFSRISKIETIMKICKENKRAASILRLSAYYEHEVRILCIVSQKSHAIAHFSIISLLMSF